MRTEELTKAKETVKQLKPQWIKQGEFTIEELIKFYKPYFLFGVTPILIIKLIFKRNIEFQKILESFPLISENRINDGTKTVIDNFTNIQISKELTEFAESKKGDLDEFLAKLEKFDDSKLRFKKREITILIQNIKRLLISKSFNITIEGTLDLKTNEISAEIKGKPFEWTAFNYYMVNNIMKDQKRIDKLYVCKKLKF